MRFNQTGEDEKSLVQHIKEHKELLERLPDGDRNAKDERSFQFWRKQYVKDVLKMREEKLKTKNLLFYGSCTGTSNANTLTYTFHDAHVSTL